MFRSLEHLRMWTGPLSSTSTSISISYYFVLLSNVMQDSADSDAAVLVHKMAISMALDTQGRQMSYSKAAADNPSRVDLKARYSCHFRNDSSIR